MAKLLRYSAVSLIAVAVTQALLVAFHTGLGLAPVTTNLLAVSLASVPAYLLNRAWVWRKSGRNSFTREVLPFWGFSLVGLAISTVAVAVASGMWESPLVVNVANLAAFGVLWVAKYVALDALIFGQAPELAVEVAPQPVG